MEASGQFHALATLFPVKEPQYFLGRRLGEPQSRSGHCGVEINLALPEIEARPSSPSLSRLSPRFRWEIILKWILKKHDSR
jgi:hypothetical protein